MTWELQARVMLHPSRNLFGERRQPAMKVMHPHPEKHYILNRDIAARHFNDTYTTSYRNTNFN